MKHHTGEHDWHEIGRHPDGGTFEVHWNAYGLPLLPEADWFEGSSEIRVQRSDRTGYILDVSGIDADGRPWRRLSGVLASAFQYRGVTPKAAERFDKSLDRVCDDYPPPRGTDSAAKE